MFNNDQGSIGLAEFIQQVKQDLLCVTPGKDKDAPFLFVESVELELQVTVKRTGKAGAKGSIKINVLGTGTEVGGELGGDLGRDDVHKVNVKLSPLFDKERLMEFYQTLHSEKVPTTVKNSLDALLKGDEEGNLNDDLGG
ncbi:MAG: trypco2 family protein [Nostocaceae cyanobacterium]|nr:trypco2 family protein [Nostocaceae cyanobacterium]